MGFSPFSLSLQRFPRLLVLGNSKGSRGDTCLFLSGYSDMRWIPRSLPWLSRCFHWASLPKAPVSRVSSPLYVVTPTPQVSRHRRWPAYPLTPPCLCMCWSLDSRPLLFSNNIPTIARERLPFSPQATGQLPSLRFLFLGMSC
jgi:hypothetical protein